MRGPLPSDRVFKFGNDGLLCSEGKYFLPAEVAGKKVEIEADMVSSDIPLLLSKMAMKKASMKLNMENDTVIVYGKKVNLVTTISGHYCILYYQLQQRSREIQRDLNCQFFNNI